MKLFSLALTLITITLFSNCTTHKNKEQETNITIQELNGWYINQTYLDSVKATRKIVGAITKNHFIGDVMDIYIHNDSATILSLIEEISCSVKLTNDTLLLTYTYDKPETAKFLVSKKDSSISLEQLTSFSNEPLKTKLLLNKYNSSTIANNDIHLKSWQIFINDLMFNNQWQYIRVATKDTVRFTNSGEIKGYNDFSTYQFCLGGDCDYAICGTTLDPLWLYKSNSDSLYPYAFEIKNDTIILREIVESEPGSFRNLKGCESSKLSGKLDKLVPIR